MFVGRHSFRMSPAKLSVQIGATSDFQPHANLSRTVNQRCGVMEAQTEYLSQTVWILCLSSMMLSISVGLAERATGCQSAHGYSPALFLPRNRVAGATQLCKLPLVV